MIRKDLVDEIVAHALRDHPREACGVLAGPEGSDRPERAIPMFNNAQSDTFYEFEPSEHQRVYRTLDEGDERVVVIYHSHTSTEAYPSRTDIAVASGPLADTSAHYVLVSTREDQPAGEHEFRSYRIVDGAVTEEPVEVVESYMFSHTGADDVPDGR